MAATTATSPGLSFPAATFAQLSPNQFLQAHLSDQRTRRPNGRLPNEYRQPVINTGSLAHSNGSAVVRLGDTAVVCGVRGEILLASDIPNPPKGDEQVERLGLIVPNLELSTGCSQAHLPGNPPSSLAQSLSWRLYTLIHSSGLVDIDDLRIQWMPPATEADEEVTPVVKAYWTLYLDVLCMSLDGACFDAAWMAIHAALQNTTLPQAHWDADHEMIVCSPHASEAVPLRLRSLAVPSTFAVFSTASPLKHLSEAQSWILADPDTFEEDASREMITITVTADSVLGVEKSGGTSVDVKTLRHCIELTQNRWKQVKQALDQR